jgi:hypothetical protein
LKIILGSSLFEILRARVGVLAFDEVNEDGHLLVLFLEVSIYAIVELRLSRPLI